MRGKWQWSALVTAAIVASALAGCAQDVGDIDRTSPNKVLKTDLTEGSWWMGQKVVTSSSTALGLFGPSEGSMAENDKVVFVVEENYLMAYRSYPILPGSEDGTLNINGTNNYEELYGDGYKGGVRAMFPIDSHFDVQRTYDAATGEQSNVIEENTSDRPWYERKYMRVKWDENVIVDPWWYFAEGYDLELGYTGTETASAPEMMPYFERDSNGTLVYFDAPATYVVKPSIYDILYMVYGLSFADPYAATEARIVTSFARDLKGLNSDGDTIRNDRYEALPYDNYDMNRFGYFRIERDTYDSATGIMNSGRILLANRHDIWENNYTTDANGNKIPLPIEDRIVKTTPFYIHGVVGEELMAKMSDQLVDEWNVAFKRAVYIMQHPFNTVLANANVPKTDGDGNVISENGTVVYEVRNVDLISEIDYPVLKAALDKTVNPNYGLTDVFVACHVPLIESDSDVCLPEYLRKQGVEKVGYTPREGDFRKNYLWLVNQNLENGLLGYGPTADDPLTSQSISSQAHVYTAYMNLMANSIVDHIKFYNGEVDADGVRANDANVARAKMNKERFIDLSKMPDSLRNAKFNVKLQHQARDAQRLERKQNLSKLKKFDYTAADARIQKMTQSGLLDGTMSAMLTNHYTKSAGLKSLSQLEKLGVKNPDVEFESLSYSNRAYMREIKKSLASKGYCFAEKEGSIMSDPEMTFFANKYKGRSDYDNIRKELRADILRSTALHEMGHTFGLRHNFAASFDSMNYFDNFWTQRKKSPVFNKENVENIDELYQIWNLTDEQMAGGIGHDMYSSIMDYYSDDKRGLGKYDHAAIVYAYSGGTSRVYDYQNGSFAEVVDPTLCAEKGGEWVTSQDPRTNTLTQKCQKFQKGLVEVFAKSADNKSAATAAEMGSFPFRILTHKDTTGISTFDDLLAVSAPYLELVHYRDFFGKANQGYDFAKSRSMARVEDYLAQKSSSNPMVRVPYVFCTDDNHGKLASCYTFDQGADLFDSSLFYMRSYQNEYWFSNFARGRAYWDSWNTYGRYSRNFERLSDLFQHWYVSDRRIFDDVMGDGLDLTWQVGEIAVNSIMNFLANVIATPEYGTFCKRSESNDIYGLSTNDEARSETSEFQVKANCGNDPDYYYVRQGEGRNRFYRYDVTAGFDYSMYELEAPHYMTSIAAIWSIFDNEADVIVDTGDMNTYSFGLYDYFTDEIVKLANAVYGENYSEHSPVLERTDEVIDFNGEQYRTGTLRYPALAKAYFALGDQEYRIDPLTGQSEAQFNKNVASVASYNECSSDSECVKADNAVDVYCARLYNSDNKKRCYNLFDAKLAADVASGKAAQVCPENTSLEMLQNNYFFCAPNAEFTDENIESAGFAGVFDKLAEAKCSAKNPQGVCNGTDHCDNGKCVASAMRVESSTSLSQKLYMIFYGMALTGMMGSDSKFFDQLHIYRLGSGETATPAEGFRTVKFEDPLTGDVYAANERDCTGDKSIWCYQNNQSYASNGGAELIHRANKIKADVQKYYDMWTSIDYTEQDEANNTEKYQQWQEAYYKWYNAKYDLEGIVYDINMLRSVYSVFGTMF